MGSETVMVDEIPFPPQITLTKPLTLLGYGITDIELQFLQIKFTAIGVYLDKENIVEHLAGWKGKKGSELAGDDLFFDAVVAAPAEKLLRVVVIKEIKGSQYGVQMESAVRSRLAAADKYEDEEEAALEKVTEFFQSHNKYLKKGSVLTIHFPASNREAEIGLATEGKEAEAEAEAEAATVKVENGNVVEMMQKWYLGGSSSVSPSTVAKLAEQLGELLV
ncbi:chalcone isomerase-like protein 2 [Zingiber officinale]|uniref:chalcone isomerase-like protein 2 n=1 Tax=Zingiber officinale TaxID=94328 RepID=UPI001C4AFEB1|nr:chalcone isomerase-like protein 2 [Zingiber officinale]